MSGQTSNKVLFQVHFVVLGKIVLSLPLFGFAFCVIWSLINNFESSTATHCRVANYLPSISSAIGGYTPQRYVWRICVALHCSPRLMVAVAYYNFHTQVHVGQKNSLYQSLSALTSLLHILENLALVGLSFISSSENHGAHEKLFVTFMVTSLLYMLLSCILFKWGRTANGINMSVKERTSFNYKVGLFLFNIISFLIAVYLFIRHNAYCEPGIYTFFALGEYLTVLSNIAFHSTAIWDFRQLSVYFGSNGLEIARTTKST
ncbi:post-GPI attachment to proteins factor 2-like isoform X1 [Pecten maximus]|uniref:post-GPI attachment to proteins factor 2-like isoform X1 n=1 Tax=Pecten maximus TaxID=6579 RepID=UPI0014582826|nr:post-GPI attachment to proteins factor 2-like isoform X1 [Pecten maximus]